MKRIALITAGMLLAGCCSSENKPAPTTTDGSSAAPATQPAATPAAAVTATPTPAPAPVATPTPTPTPEPVASPTPAVVPTPAPTPAPAIATPAPAPAAPFEWNEDGKTYLFASVDTWSAFRDGKPQPVTIIRTDLNAAGTPVIIEAADKAEADKLAAGYAKQHPMPAAAQTTAPATPAPAPK